MRRDMPRFYITRPSTLLLIIYPPALPILYFDLFHPPIYRKIPTVEDVDLRKALQELQENHPGVSVDLSKSG